MIKTPFYADNGRKLCLDEGEFFYFIGDFVPMK